MNLFGRDRRPDVPELDVDGDQATVTPRTDEAVEDAPPQPRPSDPRIVKLPKTKWY